MCPTYSELSFDISTMHPAVKFGIMCVSNSLLWTQDRGGGGGEHDTRPRVRGEGRVDTHSLVFTFSQGCQILVDKCIEIITFQLSMLLILSSLGDFTGPNQKCSERW